MPPFGANPLESSREVRHHLNRLATQDSRKYRVLGVHQRSKVRTRCPGPVCIRHRSFPPRGSRLSLSPLRQLPSAVVPGRWFWAPSSAWSSGLGSARRGPAEHQPARQLGQHLYLHLPPSKVLLKPRRLQTSRPHRLRRLELSPLSVRGPTRLELAPETQLPASTGRRGLTGLIRPAVTTSAVSTMTAASATS
jgi:hypothetical protein